MEKVTDWLTLWKQLVHPPHKSFGEKQDYREDDAWKNKARNFDSMVQKRWSQPDSSRQFIQSELENHPGSTLLDIGAGTGAWSLFLSPFAQQITALEPSDAMAEIFQEKITGQHITNIHLVKGSWPETDMPPHDYVLSSHSMYGEPDFSKFILKMTTTASRMCCLVMRAPLIDAPMAKAATHVWGQPYDSPNFQIAYNALLQMGIFPNVLMETGGSWEPWSNESREEAFLEIKNKLGVKDTTEYDLFLKNLLDEHLIEREGKVFWPVGVRSALVYWEVS